MNILKEIGTRLISVFILFIGGLVAWFIVIVVLIPLMFVVIPLIWIAGMIRVLLARD